MDKFPEAFRRYEEKVDVDKKWSFQQLLTSFGEWGKDKWIASKKQKKALAVEADIIGIKPHEQQEIEFTEKLISYVNKFGTLVEYTQKARTQTVFRNLLTGRYEKTED